MNYPALPFLSRSLHCTAAAVLALSLGLVASEPAFADRLVTCESHNNNRAYCRVDTRGGVYLQSQLSSAGCYQGSSWGYDSRGIWVANGCRATFRTGNDDYRHHEDGDNDKAAAAVAGLAVLALGAAAVHAKHEKHERERHEDDYYSYRPNRDDFHYYENRGVRHQQVTCDSVNDGYNYCRAPVHHAHVRLLRRHSNAGCEFHNDWGYNRGGIWVDNGCRATFEIE